MCGTYSIGQTSGGGGGTVTLNETYKKPAKQFTVNAAPGVAAVNPGYAISEYAPGAGAWPAYELTVGKKGIIFNAQVRVININGTSTDYDDFPGFHLFLYAATNNLNKNGSDIYAGDAVRSAPLMVIPITQKLVISPGQVVFESEQSQPFAFDATATSKLFFVLTPSAAGTNRFTSKTIEVSMDVSSTD